MRPLQRLKMLLLILCAGTAVNAVRADPTCPQFQDGDRVTLIGDSITEIGLYHSYLQLFYATRFPDRKIAFFGAGHSGGNSVDCMRRLSWDILSKSPNVATVMFGMNDMMASSQGSAATPEAADIAIARRVDEVQANYEKLLDALVQANVRLILLGPSICDDTAKLDKPILPYHNLSLTRWTERLRQIAARRNAGFVDIGTLMNELNLQLQTSDPTATLTSGDRIHAREAGNIVMAYSILKAQGIGPFVSKIAVDAATGKSGELFNCTVSGIERRPGGISFTCEEKALPFVPSKAAAEGMKLVSFTEDLNQELLSVANLPPGRATPCRSTRPAWGTTPQPSWPPG